MSDERRYHDHEIAAIFEQAAEAQAGARAHRRDEGLTLAELQEVGAAVGIAPEFVARAARAVDHRGRAAPRKTILGLPLGVSRTVVLPGPLSDGDWERLVVDLRDTFGARGRLRQDGSLRQWTNGNLQVLAEPVEGAHRLRMKTLNGSAQSGMVGGLVNLIGGLVFFALYGLMAGSGEEPPFWIPAVLVLAGLAFFSYAAVRLPSWAQERERQFEALAARASERVAAAQRPPAALPQAQPRLDLGAAASADRAADAAPVPRRSRE